ncbi:MAG: sulfate ABC transporter substrate-binding protein [Hyphomicrobiaceae bacterium]|nr:sulfate ABC transporter substrate-binding protein [Hyphomicrobiaceae bacterium]
MRFAQTLAYAGLIAAGTLIATIASARAETTLLNVSYDVARELYKDINPAFAEHWKKTTGETVTLNQSHGGSSKQALAVIGGLEADVVTMNQQTDIAAIADRGLIKPDWASRLPHGATPYTTTMIFLVRKGNPKGIKDWADLVQPGIGVVIPNPKVTGNGRFSYLAAWGYALETSGGKADAAKDFVQKLLANVPVFDGGGRGATTTFTQRDIGDVLVTFENEVNLIQKEFGADKFEIVHPSISIEAAPPVAVVDSVVDKKGTRKQAEAYLAYLFTPEAQAIIAKHYYRPRDAAALAAAPLKPGPTKLFQVEKLVGEWKKVQAEHFADGGIYDQIVVKR